MKIHNWNILSTTVDSARAFSSRVQVGKMKNFNNFFYIFFPSLPPPQETTSRARESRQSAHPPPPHPSPWFLIILHLSVKLWIFLLKIIIIQKESTKNLFANSLKSMSNAFSIAKLLLVCWGLENQRNFPHRLFVSLPSGCKKNIRNEKSAAVAWGVESSWQCATLPGALFLVLFINYKHFNSFFQTSS